MNHLFSKVVYYKAIYPALVKWVNWAGAGIEMISEVGQPDSAPFHIWYIHIYVHIYKYT